MTPDFVDPKHALTASRAIDEIASLGASHVSVVVHGFMSDVRQSHITGGADAASPSAVRLLIRRARARGMDAIVFPIVWVRHRAPGEWRGTLEPADRDRWWAEYAAFVVAWAKLAAEEHVAILSVGSELNSMEPDLEQWAMLTARVRAVYGGQLTYSANWDHYETVALWPSVDLAGVNGYFELAPEANAPAAVYEPAWRVIRERLRDFSTRIDRPILLTEVGYPSVDGGAWHPWDHGATGRVDLEEQRAAWAAFRAVWDDDPTLAGVVVWQWYGDGGPTDRSYTPRGKPAEAVIRDWWSGRWRL